MRLGFRSHCDWINYLQRQDRKENKNLGKYKGYRAEKSMNKTKIFSNRDL